MPYTELEQAIADEKTEVVAMMEKPKSRFRGSWAELLLSLSLWSIFFYGWQRALAYTSTDDTAHNVFFVLVAAVAYTGTVVMWVRSRRSGVSLEPKAQDNATPTERLIASWLQN